MSKGICPICGGKNDCYLQKNLDPAKCWCMTAKIPSQLLDRVPEEKRGESCICIKCINKYNEEKL